MLANKTLLEEQELLQSDEEKVSLETLEFMKKGVKNGRKKFSIFHFYLQLCRMFNIVFIAEYQKLFFQAIFYAVIFLITATLFDKRIVQADTCYPLNMDEESMHNFTCRDRLSAQSFSDEYKIYQAYAVAIVGTSIICISSISFIPILKVFNNEHRNRKLVLFSFSK
ncbi:hypothetical protein BLA29_005596 [Euroglyphus maynei]|uniref:Uncharacterized protein n=1 Tax=Euroglyphus maynei TaxID=6958 RepID=A0A1Y3B9F1_EURMA|nr:hypothetical protein BLA29_005596 [Euroglyphus maynei]